MSLFTSGRHALTAKGPPGRRRVGRVAVAVLAVLVAAVATTAALPRIASAATVAPRIDLKVLLLGASSTQSDFEDWQAALQREGVPFDAIITSAGHTPITASTLSTTLADGTPEGKYEAIIVANGDLTDCSVGPCVSNVAQPEWDAIEQYEKTFNIREVTGDVYPSASYGLNAPNALGSGTLDGVSGTLTADGQNVFSYLKPTASITMGPVGTTAPATTTTTYGYEATPISSTNFDTLVAGPNGSAFVGIYTHNDGVEDLVETYAQNQYLLQDQLLRHGVIAWVTRGVYLGDQRNYVETEIDDTFLADDVWNATTHSTDTNPSDAIEESASDIDYAASWSHANNFRLDMVFNGGGVTQTSGGSALLSAFKATDPNTGKPYTDSFGWVNHTWDHPKLDEGCASTNYIEAEVNENNGWATSTLGLTKGTDPAQALGYVNSEAVVTGEHSGLANLAPGVPGTVDPPEINTAAADTTSGTLPAGTYTFAITDQFSTAAGSGESTPSETVVTLSAPGSVTLTWDAVCHAADYKIYREDTATSTWYLVTTVNAPTTEPPNGSFGNPASTSNVTGGGPLEQTFTDTAADGTASSAPPLTNTATESAYEQNTQLNAALSALGITAIAADASKPYPKPANATFADGTPPATQYAAGTAFNEPGTNAEAVPRWPMNIYYNAATQGEEIDEYETLYDLPTCVPSSVTTCSPTGTAFTIGQIVGGVVNDDTGMFTHVMNNDPRPTFFHQSNLMGGSTGLFYSVMNQLLSEYNSYFNVPIEQPTLAQAAQLLAEQSAWSANASLSGYIQGNKVTIVNAGAATNVPMSGITGVGSAYGNTQSGWASVPSGSTTYTAQVAWPASRRLTVQLVPALIVANGTSQSTATVTVANSDGFPIVGENPAITSTDPGQKISAVTDNLNGTYTATITSSTTVGPSAITATDTAVAPNTVSQQATLTQTEGPAAIMTLQVSPTSIVANGKSTSTATATVKDAQGRADIGDRVAFTASDSGEKIGAVADNGNGTYTTRITSSTTPRQVTITATDSSVSPSLSAQAILTQIAAQAPAPGPASTAPAMDTTAPKVTIGGHTLAKIRGKVAVKLTCPRGQSFCAGTVALKVAGGAHRGLGLGSSHFNVTGGTTGTVKITLSKASVRKLGRAVSIRVVVAVTAQNKAGLKATTKRTMTLYLVLDAAKPIVGIGGGTLSYNGDPLAITLTCPGSQTYCDGTLALTTRKGSKVVVLGTGHFHIARDTTATIRVSLFKAALAKVGKRTTLMVAITASATDQARNTGTAIRMTTLRIRPTGA